jgi:hypothetical protein
MKTEVWRILRVVQNICGMEGLITIHALNNIIRGAGKDEISLRAAHTTASGSRTMQHPRYVLGHSKLSTMVCSFVH